MIALPPRYAFRSSLGTGGSACVDAVFDQARGERVALKRPRPGTGPAAAAALAHEFWALSAFAHPALVQAYDFGRLPGGAPYFTLALEAGPCLADAGPLPEAAVRGWLPDLLDALDVLHGAGLVHGDLRAENVRLREGGCVLLDLGHLAPAGAWDRQAAGGLAGLAPEALAAGWRDRRADLYALGALLYRAIAGRDPFEAGDDGLAGLLRAHRAEVPVPLGRLVPGVSKAFEALVAGLLAKRAGDRPPDAAAVRAALGLPAGGAARGLLAGPLVGREDLLAELDAGLARPGALALTGPAGSGRTRILAQLRHAAQLAGQPVIMVGAGGLAGLAALAVAEAGEAQPLAAALVRARWGPRASAADAAPGEPPDAPNASPSCDPLDVPNASPSCEPLDAAREKLRAHAALVSLALAAWPAALWLVDDADRLDPSDADALRALRHAGEGRWRWLLAGREAEPGLPAVDLPALDDDALARLAAAALGSEALPAGLVATLSALCAGRPGAARDLLTAWRAAGVLSLAADGWRFDAGRAEGLADTQAPRPDLPPAARALAAAAAVLGDAGSLAALAAVFAQGPEAFGPALQALLAADVLRLAGDRWTLTAPAAAWRQALTPAERQAHHARAAALAPGPDAPLAEHLAAARHAALARDAGAWPRVLAAAGRALAAHAIDPAAALLADADAALPPPTDPALADGLALARAHVLRARGQVEAALALLDGPLVARLEARRDPALAQVVTTQGVLHQLAGRYPEALARYQAAEALAAGDPAARVRARLFAGRTAHFLGDAPAAEAHLQAALTSAGEPAAAAQRAWAEALWGHWLATRGGERAAEGEALLAAAVARSRERLDPYHLHEARNNQGDAWLAAGRPGEAAAAFAECLAIATRHGLANEAVFAHANLALADLARGRARSARDHARTALAQALAQGRRYPEGLARAALGAAEVLAGEPAAGLAQLDAAVDLARGLAHRYLERLALAARADAYLLLGDREAAAADLAAAEALDAQSRDQAQAPPLAATRAALSASSPLPAGEGGRRPGEGTAARPSPTPAGHPLPAPGRGELTSAGAAELERRFWLALDDPATLAALAAEAGARGLARLSAEIAIARHDRGERLDLAAALAAARAAGLALHEAALAARQGQASHDPAQRREAARRLREIAGPLPAAGRAALAAHPFWAPAAADPLAADAEPLARFAALVAELARAPDQAALLDRALGAFVDAASAERGFLVLYDGLAVSGARQVGRAEPGFEAFSLGLAHRVLFAGEACFLEDARSDADLAKRESVRQLGLRAVAAVPLRLDGRVAGVLIADSRLPREAPWGPERGLLTALADHVAAAIGHFRHGEAMRAERDAVSEAHDLALAAMAAPGPAAAQALVLARARARVGADAAWLVEADAGAPADGPPAAARALAAWACGPVPEALALPWEEAGAAGALWALPAGPGRALVLLREAGGAPGQAETAALTRLVAVLAATLGQAAVP